MLSRNDNHETIGTHGVSAPLDRHVAINSALRAGITFAQFSILNAQFLCSILVVAYILLALWWSTVIPIGEGPDEPGHFDYALFVAREGRLPLQSEGAGEVPGEGHQPPLAYWLMQPTVWWLPPAEQTLEMGPNPRFWPAGDDANAYLRSTRDIWPYSAIGRAWHLARAGSALLCGATVALTYAIARRCLPRHPGVALGAAALVALNPQFVFAGALVSNDPLVFALGAALLLVCLMLVEPVVRAKHGLALAAGAGVLLGLLLIAKQSAVALVPLPFLALALGWWRPHPPSPAAGRGGWGARAVEAVIVATVALALAGWWYARNLRLYGDLFGLDAFRETFAPAGSGTGLPGAPAGLWELFRSSWGIFGWLTVPLNDGYHSALLTFCALAAIGLLVVAAHGWWASRASAALLLASVAVVFVWTAAFASVAGAVAWQGRFLFPAIAAMATMLAAGLAALLPRHSALWTLLALLALVSLSAPLGVIAPRYTGYVVSAQPAGWGNTRARLSLPWKRGVELRNAAFAPRATTGGALDVALTWHVLEQLDADYLVFVHLVDSAGNIVAESNLPPKNGRFPTSSWVRGDWIEHVQPLTLAGVAPGSYELYAGLWNREADRTLPVVDDEGTITDWRHLIGRVEIIGK